MGINWFPSRTSSQAQSRRRANSTGAAPETPPLAAIVEQLEERTLLAAVWESAGPGPIENGQVEGMGDQTNPVTGAAHVVLAHPTDPDILYVGGVNGGIWRTTNATADEPTWTPLTDELGSLSISSLEFDPTDIDGDTIIAGIGRYSEVGDRDGGPRTGIIRSTNGGNSWTEIDGGGTLVGKNISGVSARTNTIVVSVNTSDNGQMSFGDTGIFRSTNGGTTFTQISSGDGSGASGLPAGVSTTLAGDPTDNSVLYTSVIYADANGGTNGLYRSADTGLTWTKVSSPAIDALIISGTTTNVEFAVGNSGEVYAGIINNGQLAGLYRSADGQTGWTALDLPQTIEGGNPVGLFPTPSGDGTPDSLGSLRFSIVADPTDSNIVYVGGDRQPTPFPNSLGANDSTGRLFRVNASLTTGTQAASLTHLIGVSTNTGSAPHSDSRDMTFDAAGNLIEVDGGGIYRRTTPTGLGDWTSLNGDLVLTETRSVTYDTISNVILAGAHDVGTIVQSGPGSATWTTIHAGDGAVVVVDNISQASSGRSVRYTSSQALGGAPGGLRRVVVDATGAEISNTAAGLSVASSGGQSLFTVETNDADTNDIRSLQPVFLNSVDPTRGVIATGTLYESIDQFDTLTNISGGDTGNFITAVAYGGVSGGVVNEDVLYYASGANLFVRTVAAGAFTALTNYPGDAVVDIVLDPDEWMTAYVIDSNQVFVTTDAGDSWMDITGDLGDSALGALRTIEFIEGYGGVDGIVVGASNGVFSMPTDDPGDWSDFGNATLPNTIVTDLRYDAADNLLVAGLLGRGAFTASNVSQEFGNAPVLGDLTYTENDPPTIIAPAATVTAMGSFANGTLTATLTNNGESSDRLAIRNQGVMAGQIGVSGNTITFGGVPIGTFVGGMGTDPIVVSFNGAVTTPAIQALIRNLTYENVSDNPGTGVRSLAVALVDSNGDSDAPAQGTITVVAVADNPIVGLGGQSRTTPNPNALYSINRSTDDLVAINASNGNVTVIGDIGFNFFLNTELAFSDGFLWALTANTDNIAGAGETYTLVQINPGTGAMVNSVPVTFMGSAPATIDGLESRPNGTLAVSFNTNFVGTLNPVTGVITNANQFAGLDINGLATNPAGTLISVDTAPAGGSNQQISFSSLNEAGPTATPLGSFIVNNGNVLDMASDGTNFFSLDTGTGNLYSHNVTTPDDPLTTMALTGGTNLVGLAGDLRFRYTEASTPLLVAPAAMVTDVDSIDFEDGALTVSLTDNASIGDELSIRNQGMGAGQVGIIGSDVYFSGVLVGTRSGGLGGVDLTVTFNAASTPGAVQGVLRNITFTTDADIGAFRTIEFDVTDGDGGTAATARTQVVLVFLNDAPMLMLPVGDIEYVENDPPVSIADTAVLTDNDSLDFDNGIFRAQITANAQPTDRIRIRNQGTGTGQIGVDGNNVTYEGTIIGTFSGADSAQLFRVDFNEDATPEAVQALIRNVTFEAATDDPSGAVRTLVVSLTDGDGGSTGNLTRMINVTPVNDDPEVNNLGGPVNYEAGETPQRLSGSAAIVDPDSPNFNGGTLSIQVTGNAQSSDRVGISGNVPGTGITLSGSQVFFNGQLIGTFSGGSGGNALNVNFTTNNATRAAVESLTHAITYSNTSQFPSTLQRTISWTLTDGDGGTSDVATMLVNVFAEGGIPRITNVGGPVTYTEKGPDVLIAANGNVNDADSANFDGGVLTVTISANGAAKDRITIRNQGTGAGQINTLGSNVRLGTTVIGTFTNGVGTATPFQVLLNANATPAAVQALLRNIQFRNIDALPSEDPRTLDIQVSDGDGGVSTVVQKTVNVVGVPDPPLVTTLSGNPTWTEGGPPVRLAAGVTVNDADSADFNGGSLVVQLTTNVEPDDRLSVRSEGAGPGQVEVTLGNNIRVDGVVVASFTGGNGSDPLVITFNSTNATVANVQAIFRNVTFTNVNSLNPTPNPRTVSFVLSDGDGGVATPLPKMINISIQNVTPVIGGVTGPIAYTEGQASFFVLPNGTITDSDTPVFENGVLTVAFNGNGEAADRLKVRHIGNGAGQIGVVDENISFGGTAIGTFSGGIGTDPLVIQLNGNATQAAVRALLRAITYQNLGDRPGPTRSIGFTISDGDGATSATVFQQINITGVNDAPTVAALGGPVTFIEGNGPVVLAPAGTVTDIDSANFAGGTLTVSLTINGETNDRVAIRNQGTGAGQIGVAGSNVSFGGTVIGTFSGGTGTTALTINLNTSATPAAVQALLRNITFSNVSSTPFTGVRTVRFVVTDGDGGSSTPAAMQVNIQTVNEPVITNLGSAPTYRLGNAPAIITTTGVVTDSDTPNYNGGRFIVQNLGGHANDVLSIRNQGNGPGQIAVNFTTMRVSFAGNVFASFEGGTGTTALVFRPNTFGTPAAIQALLRNLTFSNTNTAASTANRTITFLIRDGAGVESNLVSKTVNVTAPPGGRMAAPESNNRLAATDDPVSSPQATAGSTTTTAGGGSGNKTTSASNGQNTTSDTPTRESINTAFSTLNDWLHGL